MMVCKELGKTLEEGMSMSVFELKCWAAFFKQQNDMEKQAYQKAKSVKRR